MNSTSHVRLFGMSHWKNLEGSFSTFLEPIRFEMSLLMHFGKELIAVKIFFINFNVLD